uniref:U3 small nucleolar RNA-associated protein 13 C-terminal domain-containing protein n=1 Tax=Kalanchoe fedtschenkoi TaxID=63787 RepID=A0A7N0U0S9_KALFE
MATLSYKKNYRCVPSLQQFYTGGPFAVSSDGSFLVCACDDAIKIVDTSNASIRSTIEGDSENVGALALTPDDKFVISASHSRQLRVWEVASLKCVRSWKGQEGPVRAMACHASGGLVATAGADRKVNVWDVEGGYCTHFFRGHGGVVSSVAFHPDPDKLLLFSGGEDGTVRVWDLATKECIISLEKHFSTVTSLAFSEDGWTLLSAGRDKVVNLWDLHDYSFKSTVPTFESLESLCVIHSASPFATCLDSHRKKNTKEPSDPVYFITVGERGIVRVWNSISPTCLFEQKSSDVTINASEDDRRGFTAATMLPFDQGLLCVTADLHFLFYSSLEYAEEMFNLELRKRLIGHNEEISDMKFLDDEEQSIVLSTNLEQISVYDLATMSCSYMLAGHTDRVLSLDTCTLSSGKSIILSGSKDNTVRLWDAESRCCIGVGVGHTEGVGAVAFSKRRKNFFVSGSRDRTLKIWNFEVLFDDAGKPTTDLRAKAVVAAHDKEINSLAVAPNDAFVCSGSQDRTASVWRLPDLVRVFVLKGHRKGVWSVEFSPVDQCVLTSSADKTIKIWNLQDGSCLKTFEGHTASVYRASYLTRGSQIISCGADGLTKLWTIKTNECIATYDQHEDRVWALAVGKTTEMLATGSNDGVIILWYDSTTSEKEEAFLKKEEEALKDQELNNAIQDANYTKAIQIAYELRKPHKLFNLFKGLCRKGVAEKAMDDALRAIGKEDFRLLFEYIRDWNTKPKLCHVAQSLLARIFTILPPTEIIEMKGISEILEGIMPHSQRHFSRVDRLVRGTYLLEYTLMGMRVMEPETDTIESKDISDSTLKLNGLQQALESSINPTSENDDNHKQNQATEQTDEKANSKRRKRKKSQSDKQGLELASDTNSDVITATNSKNVINKTAEDGKHPNVSTSTKKRKKRKSSQDVAYASVAVSL